LPRNVRVDRATPALPVLGSKYAFSLGIALSILQRRFKFRIAVIAAAALLIAQLGAMTHAYSHTRDLAPASSHQTNTGNHDFCGDCLNFAPVLSAAGTPAVLHFVEPQGRSVCVHAECRSLIDRTPHLAFRSRAPPVTH
jgi:hypothetical protein